MGPGPVTYKDALLIFSSVSSFAVILAKGLGFESEMWVALHWLNAIAIAGCYPLIFILPSVPRYSSDDLSSVAKHVGWFVFDLATAVAPIVAVLIMDSAIAKIMMLTWLFMIAFQLQELRKK